MAHRPRIGEYRFIDDESGFSYPSSQLAKRWDGAIVARKNDEIRQPQMDVRGLRDPAALTDVRPRGDIAPYCPLPWRIQTAPAIGVSTVGRDPVEHRVTWLYRNTPSASTEPYIAATSADPFGMTVACTLVVYPSLFRDAPPIGISIVGVDPVQHSPV